MLEVFVGLAFAITGYYQMKMFKKNMPFFYDKSKYLLFVTNVGLSLPCMAVGFSDIIVIYFKTFHKVSFDDWEPKHRWQSYIFNFVLGDVVCVFTQFMGIAYRYLGPHRDNAAYLANEEV